MPISKIIYKSSDQATPVTWMDTTDKTVTAGSMLNGITALKNDGTGITGNIASKTSSDLTANNLTVTAPAGYYANAATKTLSDSNLVAGNVKKDVTIFGTTGTYEGAGGGGDTYTRTVIVPQQTTTGQTPTLTHTGALVDGDFYVVTIDGTEYIVTAGVQWSGGAIVLGTLQWYYTWDPPGEYDYPWAVGYEIASADMDCAFPDSGTHTIKVEHLEFVDGPLNLIEKSITQNGTYNASSDNADGYSSVVVNVSGGGGVEEKDVNFIDDVTGEIVHSYTAAEFANLSALPANPSHTGLTAQGWNWSLSDAKTYVASYGKLWIGQMYVTDDGKTRIYIHLDDANYLSPYLAIAVNGTVVVDWGDGSNTDTITGVGLTTKKYQLHEYATVGDYIITIAVSSGRFAFYGTSSMASILLSDTNNRSYDRTYCNSITRIEVGSSAGIGNYAFQFLNKCKTITIPSGIESVGNSAFNYSLLKSITLPPECLNAGSNAFSYCGNLHYFSFPKMFNTLGSNVFSYSSSLKAITLPPSITNIGSTAFGYCYKLQYITIPATITTIPSYMIRNCISLQSITIPSTVTNIQTYAFYGCSALLSVIIPHGVTNFGTYVFNSCYSIKSITIPSSVDDLGDNVFANCYGVKEYRFLSTTVPTIGASAFSGIVAGTIIYVPYSADHSILNAYKAATNWSTYASYMQEEPQ